MFKNILFSMMFLVSSLLANTLGLEDNGDGTWNVSYSSEDIIAGFQFDVDDATVNSASGGDATANGFMLSASPTTVLGFSLSGGTIPVGNGTLLVLDLSGTPASLSGIVVSDPSGNALVFSYDSGDPEPTLPTVSIISPANGSSIEGNTINVEVAGTDMGEGDHYHASLDGSSLGMFYDDSFSIDNLSFGDHTLSVVVADGGHAEYDHAGSSASVSFNNYEAGISGCTDMDACNYNADATMDDGSCEFESCDCPEDVNGDGVISVADILVLLGEFGCTSGCSVDINDDDATNVQDILLLLAAFGTTC